MQRDDLAVNLWIDALIKLNQQRLITKWDDLHLKSQSSS